jgi:hypothetical protein
MSAMANRPIRPEQITSIEELYRLSESDLMALSRKASFYVHLADPIGCLARIRQVLKPGGVCIIANPIGRFDHLLSYFIRRPTARLAQRAVRDNFRNWLVQSAA